MEEIVATHHQCEKKYTFIYQHTHMDESLHFDNFQDFGDPFDAYSLNTTPMNFVFDTDGPQQQTTYPQDVVMVEPQPHDYSVNPGVTPLQSQDFHVEVEPTPRVTPLQSQDFHVEVEPTPRVTPLQPQDFHVEVEPTPRVTPLQSQDFHVEVDEPTPDTVAPQSEMNDPVDLHAIGGMHPGSKYNHPACMFISESGMSSENVPHGGTEVLPPVYTRNPIKTATDVLDAVARLHMSVCDRVQTTFTTFEVSNIPVGKKFKLPMPNATTTTTQPLSQFYTGSLVERKHLVEKPRSQTSDEQTLVNVTQTMKTLDASHFVTPVLMLHYATTRNNTMSVVEAGKRLKLKRETASKTIDLFCSVVIQAAHGAMILRVGLGIEVAPVVVRCRLISEPIGNTGSYALPYDNGKSTIHWLEIPKHVHDNVQPFFAEYDWQTPSHERKPVREAVIAVLFSIDHDALNKMVKRDRFATVDEKYASVKEMLIRVIGLHKSESFKHLNTMLSENGVPRIDESLDILAYILVLHDNKRRRAPLLKTARTTFVSFVRSSATDFNPSDELFDVYAKKWQQDDNLMNMRQQGDTVSRQMHVISVCGVAFAPSDMESREHMCPFCGNGSCQQRACASLRSLGTVTGIPPVDILIPQELTLMCMA